MAVLLLVTASALAGGSDGRPAPSQPGGSATISQATAGPWRQVFFDDFSDGVQSARWGDYLGHPGGTLTATGTRPTSTASNGIARLETYRDPDLGNRWASGGMSSAVGLTQTYGRWEVRFRFDPGYGVGGVILLWPEDGGWPPEIDIYENGGETTDRREMSATLHYSPSNQTIQRTLRNTDFSAWHTVGVEWTPGRVVYLVDGSPWGSVTGPEVPDQPMWLAVQTASGRCGDQYAPCPDSSTPSKVVMEVDWVKGWKYDPSATALPPGGGPPSTGPGSGGRALTTGIKTRRSLSRSTAKRRGIPAVVRCSLACTARLVARIRSAHARKLGLKATGRWHVIGRRTQRLAAGKGTSVRIALPRLRDARLYRVPVLPVVVGVSATTSKGAKGVARGMVTIVR